MFKHELGAKAQARVTKLTGIITCRSESLYGCNRYLIQPEVSSDQKVPDPWWVDEDDLEVIEAGVIQRKPKDTGGPMSKVS